MQFDSAFGTLDKNSDMIREYWRDLRENWRSVEQTIRRTALLVFIFAGAFVLLQENGVEEVAFGGLKLTNLPVLTVAIPVIVAYLGYVISLNAAQTILMGALHDALAKHYWPDFSSANLQLAVKPTGAVNDTSFLSSCMDLRLGNAIGYGAAVRFFVLIGTPLVFEVYGVVTMLNENAVSIVLRWAAAVIIVLLVVACVPNLIGAGRLIRAYDELFNEPSK